MKDTEAYGEASAKEGAAMAVRIIPKPDDRAEKMVSDPAGYFKAARDRIRAEVVEDLHGQRDPQRSGQS